LDYEYIPFTCRKYHGNDHLFNDLSRNEKKTKNKGKHATYQEGITMVLIKLKQWKKPINITSTNQSKDSNSFHIVASTEGDKP